jgi:hypothetical protein
MSEKKEGPDAKVEWCKEAAAGRKDTVCGMSYF